MLSLVVPVYGNEESIPALLETVLSLDAALQSRFEAVFVVDGSPDRSLEILSEQLPLAPFRSQLIALSRNFGSFSAIVAGLRAARGDYFAVMSADLQEPPALVLEFSRILAEDAADIVVGTRSGRADPFWTRMASQVFWSAYRHLVQPQIPRGGIDVFACNSAFRTHLLSLSELNSTLVGLVVWLGFRRREVPYVRRPRRFGRSGWSLRRKLRYLLDSVFAFSDLPVRILSLAGLAGLTLSVLLGAVVVVTRLLGGPRVPGYAATVLAVMFFGGLNSLGIGILGEYLWRTFENTKRRPQYVVAASAAFGPTADEPARSLVDGTVQERE